MTERPHVVPAGGADAPTPLTQGGLVLRFTPRLSWSDEQRDLLGAYAHLAADCAFAEVEEFGDNPVSAKDDWNLFNRLPAITYTQPAVWRMMAARAFDDLANDLDYDRVPVPRCVVEYVALSLLIEDAEIGSAPSPHWATARHALVDTALVASLYAAEPAPQFGELRGVPDPIHWFDPLCPRMARDPRRGIRGDVNDRGRG